MDGTDKVIIALGFFSIIGMIVYFVFLSNGGSLIPMNNSSNGSWTVADLKNARQEMRSNNTQ